jgi:ABC-type polysaccharide/polyol phosphate export permease
MNLVAYELANFSLSFLGLFILGTLLGKIHYSAALLFIPVALVLIFFFTFGIAAMISVFSVFFRDLLFVIPVIMQAFLFLTPIYYQVEHAPRLVIILSKYNPFLQYIELIRQPLWAQTLPSIKILIGTLFCSFLFFTLGMVILKKFDNKIIFRL